MSENNDWTRWTRHRSPLQPRVEDTSEVSSEDMEGSDQESAIKAESTHAATTANTSKKVSFAPEVANHSPSSERTPQQSMRKSSLTEQELRKRDEQTIAYSRTQLEDGDTMVFIKYPEGNIIYDSAGYKLSTTARRVHSDKLLATGSEEFKKLLSDRLQQKFKRRHGFLTSPLPPGINYILDLTPPEEGEELVDIIAALSCSQGIRHWYATAKRWGNKQSFVGGKDEVAKPISQTYQDNTRSSSLHHSSKQYYADSSNFKNPGIAYDPKIDGPMPVTEEYYWTHLSSAKPGPATSRNGSIDEATFQRVLEQSRQEFLDTLKPKEQLGPNEGKHEVKLENVLEYCPIRHRTGIEKLLQVIEGRVPSLDSAPKVWTLFALAMHFDCTHEVCDYIVAWLLTEPNNRFIEMLPEASLKIGLGLKSPAVTRRAFSFLVSEEALSVAAVASSTPLSPGKKTLKNKFGRIKEDIDEDMLNVIQAAASDFQIRIKKVFDDLVDEKLTWLEEIPEFQKLDQFLIYEFGHLADSMGRGASRVENFKHRLRHYVRGRLISVILQRLTLGLIHEGNQHRDTENYLRTPRPNFEIVYNDLQKDERIMTRFFWHMLKDLGWGLDFFSNSLSDNYGIDRRLLTYNVENVNMKLLEESRDSFNWAVLENKDYHQGRVPEECYPLERVTNQLPFHFTARRRRGRVSFASDETFAYDTTYKSDYPHSYGGNNLKSGVAGSSNADAKDYPLGYDGSNSSVGLAGSSFSDDEDGNKTPTMHAQDYRSSKETKGSPDGFESFDPLDEEPQSPLKKLKKNPSTETLHSVKLSLRPLLSEEPLLKKKSFHPPGLEHNALPKRPRILGKPDLSTENLHPPGLEDNALPILASKADSPALGSDTLPMPDSKASVVKTNDGLYKIMDIVANADILGTKAYSPVPEKYMQTEDSTKASALETAADYRAKILDIKSSSPFSQKSQQLDHVDTLDTGFNASANVLGRKPNFTPSTPLGEIDNSSDIEFDPPVSPPILYFRNTTREPILPSDAQISHTFTTPLFSLTDFFDEISSHIMRVSNTILSHGEVDRSITDTLLCLTDNEFKYLPLWAGGMDDGSGGVFNADVPNATLGPNGPGPAYHTGFSMASRASTEVGYDGESTVDTSVAVENGYSDHFDRRRVMALGESEFGDSVTGFSQDSEDYGIVGVAGAGSIDKGKGKAVEADDYEDDFMVESDEEAVWED